jgi:hypothetical protein
MPDTPTPGVNGQSLSGPALQASISMLSFDPAASTFGWAGSIAIAGSFCLLAENGLTGLPALTRVSWAAAGAATAKTQSRPAAMARTGGQLRKATSRVGKARRGAAAQRNLRRRSGSGFEHGQCAVAKMAPQRRRPLDLELVE